MLAKTCVVRPKWRPAETSGSENVLRAVGNISATKLEKNRRFLLWAQGERIRELRWSILIGHICAQMDLDDNETSTDALAFYTILTPPSSSVRNDGVLNSMEC